MSKKKPINRSKVWLKVALGLAVLPWLGNFLIGVLYRLDGEHNKSISEASGVLVWVSGVTLILIVIALFYVQGRNKLVVALAIAATIIAGYIALFNHTWLA